MTGSKKCQNRNGKSCIKYKGKNIYYLKNNAADLGKKLNITPRQARKLIKDNGRRIVIGPGDKTLLINLKDENFTGLLRKFNINRVDNKKIINDISDFPKLDTSVVKELGPNDEIKVNIKIILYINFPSPLPLTEDDITNNGVIDKALIQHYVDIGAIEIREQHLIYHGYTKNIPKFINDEIAKYMNRLRFGDLLYSEFRIGDFYKNRKLNFENGYIREFNDVFKLTEWVNIEYSNNVNDKDTCAVKYIGNKYPELYWKIKKLETKKGILVKQFMEFCKNNDIGYNIYDEQGNKKYDFDGNNGILNCIIFNNHIYPINGGKPKKYSTKEVKIKYVKSTFKSLEKLLNNNILPSKIRIESIQRKNKIEHINRSNINLSYQIKEKRYIDNDEYDECLKILTEIGYEKYISENIRLTDIPILLEKILKTPDLSSFIPEMDKFRTSPLLWKTNKNIDVDNVKTIDKNKCYSYCLYRLPYLLKFDYRKNNINLNPKKIKDDNLYLAKPKQWSILMTQTKLYPGYFLLECKELGFEFDLLEELECEKVPNYYRQIINLLYDVCEPLTFKNMINITIGMMERDYSEKYNLDYVGLFSDEAVQSEEGFCKKIGKHNLLFKETKQFLHVRNKLPIATQIKDMSRMILYKKIKELKIKDENLVQINTDSISYYGELPKKLCPKKFNFWKSTEFKEIGEISEPYDYGDGLSVKNILNDNNNKRFLHMKYAGAGKTTYIINKLIPELVKNNISYIVLTPTHNTKKEYNKYGINCEIMQKYVFANTIPEEDYIIIDEIGFVDRSCHDLLYKINKANKSFECFGDFNQLQPVGETLPSNKIHYLEYMFNIFDKTFINYRNNFTKEYYDKLINEEIDIIKEVNKYSSDINDAEYILCYRHKTKDMYNKMMLKKLGFKNMFQSGVKLVSNSNYFLNCLNDKNDLNKICYNQKQYIVYESEYIDENNYQCKLKDEFGNVMELPSSIISKKFDLAYAINIHQAQGMTLKSYHWANEDNKFLYGNVAYTIISRLSSKKTKENIEIEKINNTINHFNLDNEFFKFNNFFNL